MKHNHCSDVVSDRDIEVLEMLKWFKLMNKHEELYEEFHQCSFNAWKYDMWKRGMSDQQLYNLYNRAV